MDMKKSVKQTAKLLSINGKLKRTQVEAINDVLDGHDLLVVAPISFGKSAIFQIPSIIKGGLTIVLVPTLSLLHDQTDRLQQLGISVGTLASDCISWDNADIQAAIRKHGYLLLYTTPEPLWKLDLSDFSVTCLVVDECHCVTSWGYGFRKAYLEIGDFVDRLSRRPQIIALTATAPLPDRGQIKRLLHMKHVKEHVVSLYRPKLTFSAYSFVSEEVRQKKLKSLLKKHMETSDGACIIYCNTKKNTRAVYDLVKRWYPEQAAICHSNLPNGERKRNEKEFLHGHRRIMVLSHTQNFFLQLLNMCVFPSTHMNTPLYRSILHRGRFVYCPLFLDWFTWTARGIFYLYGVMVWAQCAALAARMNRLAVYSADIILHTGPGVTKGQWVAKESGIGCER